MSRGPSVQAVFLLRFAVAFLMGTGTAAPDLPALAAGATAWTLATLYVYVINGVHDAPEDRLNATGRPIGRGELPPLRARTVAHACAALAVLVSVTSGVPALTPLVIVHLLCGHAYSAPAVALKRRTSTTVAAVLLLGGLTFAAGWTTAGGRADTLPVIVFGGALTLWMGAVGALVKDLSDVRGDAAAGRRTALIRWGERRARVVCALNPVALALAYLTTAAVVVPSLLASAAVLLAGAVVTACLVRTTSSDAPRRRSRLPYRAFMLTQYATCLVQLTTELS
ncbi:UbiA family prenyltransferase [Streptomyces sp. NPDC059680]|uniref:UbiA family prenyltransferase n=1 Tax=Streptomyces sp. NPDC059680 TaxID=3346904 RepID=UPI0036BFB49D